MRFVVDKAEQQKCMTIVTGRTTVGTIKGIWKYAEPPAVNNRYHVELNIEYPCELTTLDGRKASPCVSLDQDQVTFHGACEDVDEEVYYIRFDVDWLEMLEIGDIAFKKKVGDPISFSASIYGIEIYPYIC